MMHNTPFDERANAYLDGDMGAAEIAAFEAEMRANPALAEAVGDVRTAEAGLREIFEHEAEAPDPLAFAVPATNGRAMRRPAVYFAAAAAVLIAAAGLFYIWQPATPTGVPGYQFIYSSVVANFTPAVVCDTPKKFAEYTETSLGESIDANFDAASNLGISLVGWSVLGGSYDEERAKDLPRLLLARGPDGTEIVVYFRERGHAEPEAGDRDAVSVHTKKFGSVIAYEISPLAEPVVLSLLTRE